MTFTHRGEIVVAAPPAAVWRLWSDVASWPQWDPPVEAVDLAGPFAAGAAGTLTLAGGIAAPVVLTVVEPGARYVDELRLGELVITIDHRVVEHPDGALVAVATTIEGPGADDVGPMVTADAPRALEALAAMAVAAAG